MKLFTPTQAKQSYAKSHEDEIAQVAYLTQTLSKLQLQINREEENFSKRLEEQRALYNEVKEQLQAELRYLESRCEKEESRLVRLMKPIDGIKERALAELALAEHIKADVEQKQKVVHIALEKLSEASENMRLRDSEISRVEASQLLLQKQIEEKQEMVDSSLSRLGAVVAEVEATHEKRMKLLVERENAVEARIKANNAYVDSRSLELNAKEALLNDRLQMVERDIKRLKAKKK